MLKCTEVSITQIRNREQHHNDVFQITWAHAPVVCYMDFSGVVLEADLVVDARQASDLDDDATSADSAEDAMSLKYGINARGIAKLYPFHIMFDKECNIVQAGKVFLYSALC